MLHGQSWVLVDGAILDVSEFSHRHPGGARLILNAVGTDVTHELLGEDLSVGHAAPMSFSPHIHPEVSEWRTGGRREDISVWPAKSMSIHVLLAPHTPRVS